MIETIKKRIEGTEPFRALTEKVRSIDAGETLTVRGIHGSLMAFAAAAAFEASSSQVLLLVPDTDRAEQLRDDCALLLGESNVRLYSHGSGHKGALLDMTAPIAQIEALKALAGHEAVVLVASAEAVAHHVPSLSDFKTRTLEVTAGQEYSFSGLIDKLTTLGFERKDFVEEYGDFSVRGGILDVFPFIGDNPVRIEFWGDSIESIREFDALSQRSIRELQTANIVARLLSPDEPSGTTASLFTYLASNAVILVDEPAAIQKEIEELFHEGVENLATWDFVDGQLKRFRTVVHSLLSEADRPAAVNFSSFSQPPAQGSIKVLLRQLRELNSQDHDIVLVCDTRDEADRLRELLEEEVTSPSASDESDTGAPAAAGSSLPEYLLMTEALHLGFVYPAASLALLTEHQIFGRLKRRGVAKRRRFKGFSQKEALQLRRGDYVVHIDYGIGKFAGLQKLKVRGGEQEVMKVLYDGNDALYVNLNFVNRVQKYASQEGHLPKLSKLGAPDWERLKARARKRIKDIARELIALYARRRHEQGFAYAPDTHWQKELEASFLYEDTPDQAKATSDVKQDMERPSPMDRLICGDVGFGKTEVAVRAAFKAVMGGKQVAVLVPTTILAQQHYNTFLDRVGRYSVRVESISRFKSKKEQEGILEGIQAGTVDVLIGTHRLLSKDVKFKDLGLLVIDEEHRFGVTAKEKLRELRATVDTMTLTATPIPRTLQFSLMGARDLSLINTPPRNRLPILTEIAQFDIQLIREAILKELRRGGQVYFIHDRVHDIEEVQSLLHTKIPEARFHVAHGQMKGHELEKAMLDFLEKKYDVLICTKIIESGIDIPSVNTIVINRADRFGLAELYQLRGRVGRSNEQAYAYLLTPPISSLPRATLRRLQAIQEFTELGSGFNLAMRDLEIRGAGNLLGAEQSGFILEMGIEMYQRTVEEAVAELKEQEFNKLFEGQPLRPRAGATETTIDADIEAYIPDIYVESDSERLDFYRRLYTVNSIDEIRTMKDELRDRFGGYPEEVEQLFGLVELKTIAARIGFIKIELSGRLFTLFFPPAEVKHFYESTDGHEAPFQIMMGSLQMLKQYRAHLKQDGKQLKLLTTLPSGTDPASIVSTARELLNRLDSMTSGMQPAKGEL
ncbi:MAG TPA: transcription-repair coupling factor [Bacteroidetes bacterium]|nr:transcription-repair coupling factor [Bacteroidota bacterium]